jgi:hypothetical protein
VLCVSAWVAYSYVLQETICQIYFQCGGSKETQLTDIYVFCVWARRSPRRAGNPLDTGTPCCPAGGGGLTTVTTTTSNRAAAVDPALGRLVIAYCAERVRITFVFCYCALFRFRINSEIMNSCKLGRNSWNKERYMEILYLLGTAQENTFCELETSSAC